MRDWQVGLYLLNLLLGPLLDFFGYDREQGGSAVVDLSVGKDSSGRSRGYTHAIFARFEDAAGLREYMEHPAHLAVVEKLDVTTSGRIVADYEF
jgi:hypothetical protein